MNKIVLSFLALLCCINIQAGVKLQKQGSATQLLSMTTDASPGWRIEQLSSNKSCRHQESIETDEE